MVVVDMEGLLLNKLCVVMRGPAATTFTEGIT
jgi:hypothetical protein